MSKKLKFTMCERSRLTLDCEGIDMVYGNTSSERCHEENISANDVSRHKFLPMMWL